MNTADASIISASKLTRRFGALTAVDRLDLEIAAGEIFALVGPDGAGKTTTMRLLCGLMDPTEGSVSVVGHDVVKETELVRDQIGYMAQRFGLYQDLTVDENMFFYSDLFGVTGKERVELTTRLLRMTRMEPFRKRSAGKLSGGMKQKLALMCTLLHKPRVLFLDEPTNGVDPVSRRDFWAILYQLVHDGLTVLVTTAYLDEAERASRVGLMHRGRMIRCDTPAKLRQDPDHAYYNIHTVDPHSDFRGTVRLQLRETLEKQPGVLAVQPTGADLRLYVNERQTSAEKLAAVTPFTWERITPSLEDVFIALVRQEELRQQDAEAPHAA
jgi:ABC-2 type transport system ATP-binding protein